MSWLLFSFFSVLLIMVCGVIFFKMIQTAESVFWGLIYAIIINILLFIIFNSFYKWFI